MTLVLDTGALLAALDAADPDHAACAELIQHAREDLAVPSLVLAELAHWCRRRLGAQAWLAFLDDVLAGAYRVEPLTPADLERCRELQGADTTLGIVDASVLALAERLGDRRVASLDRARFGSLRVLP